MSLGGGFWWDDWSIILIAVCFISPYHERLLNSTGSHNSILSIELHSFHRSPRKRHVDHSFRRYHNFLPRSFLASSLQFDRAHVFQQQFYFAEVLYAFILPFTKTSILFFYLRIFPGTTFRRITWCLIVVSTLTAVIFTFVNAFQCAPVNHYWRQWDGEPGRCISPSGPAWSISVIGIVIDFLMLGLPIYHIRELNLHWRKRLNASLMFSIGFLYVPISSAP